MLQPRVALLASILALGCADDASPGAGTERPPPPPPPGQPAAAPDATWLVHWFEAQNCVLYGPDAVVKVAFDVIDGRTAEPPQVVSAPCDEGKVTLTLRSSSAVHAMFVVDGGPTGRRSPSSVVSQDVHDNHDLYFLIAPPN